MHTLDLVLLVLAAGCFALAAGNATAKVNLVALGLFFWVLVPLIAVVHSG